MKKINTLKTKHAVLFSLAVIVCHYLLSTASKALLLACGLPNDGTIRWYLPREILVFAISLGLVFLCVQKHILSPRKGFFRSLWSGAIFFVLAATGCPSVIIYSLENGKEFASAAEIAAFVVFVFLVGLAEEFLFRGIITDCLLERYGKTPRGVAGAVLLSGVLFGCAHITNIFAGQPVDETIVQVIVVSLTGILLSAIYTKHRNVYGVAFLHALLDLLTMCDIGFFGGNMMENGMENVGFWAMLSQGLISQGVFFVITLFVLHPGVLKRIAANDNGQNI